MGKRMYGKEASFAYYTPKNSSNAGDGSRAERGFRFGVLRQCRLNPKP